MLDVITQRLEKNNGILERVIAVFELEEDSHYIIAAATVNGCYASWRVNAADDSCHTGIYCDTAEEVITAAYNRVPHLKTEEG